MTKRKPIITIVLLFFLIFFKISSQEDVIEHPYNNYNNHTININVIPLAAMALNGFGIGIGYEFSIDHFSGRIQVDFASLKYKEFFSDGYMTFNLTQCGFRWYPFTFSPIGLYLGFGGGFAIMSLDGKLSNLNSIITFTVPHALLEMGGKFDLSKKGKVHYFIEVGAQGIFMFPGHYTQKGDNPLSQPIIATYFMILPTISMGVYF